MPKPPELKTQALVKGFRSASPAQTFPNIWVEFDAAKAAYFGPPLERADTNRRHILAAKRLVYRYCMFGVQYGTTVRDLSSSGLARNIIARDLMVTFGGWAPRPITKSEQAGTLMHELGHTLGLLHGGGDTVT